MEEYFNVADIFGENVFNDSVMQERLPKKTYQKLKQTILAGEELDLETADVIAHEMKEWAIEKGATHTGSSHLQESQLKSMIHLFRHHFLAERFL